MSVRSWSLRRRLLAWLVLPLLVLSAVMLVEAFVRARDAAGQTLFVPSKF